jgi:hypothetical protein
MPLSYSQNLSNVSIGAGFARREVRDFSAAGCQIYKRNRFCRKELSPKNGEAGSFARTGDFDDNQLRIHNAIIPTSLALPEVQVTSGRVVRAGIEPATHGFSVHCSTN